MILSRFKYLLMTIFTVVVIYCYNVVRATEWNELVKNLRDWAPWVTVITTGLSPLIAIQVTGFLGSRKERNQKRETIFITIFSLRNGNPNDYHYFTNLNLIPVYFINEKRVIESFEEYFDAMISRSNHIENSNYDVDKYNTLYSINLKMLASAPENYH